MSYTVVGISDKYYSLFLCPARHHYLGHLIHQAILNPFCLFYLCALLSTHNLHQH